MLNDQPSSENALGTIPPKASRSILIGSTATTLAFGLSLAIMAIGTHHLDWISPPVAALGFLGCMSAIIAGCQPRGLALGMLGLNLLYWFYFCLMLASRR